MATMLGRPVIEAQATLLLTEEELRALDAVTGYGLKAFMEVFYEKMGRSYLEPHAQGLKTLFETVRARVPSILSAADEARKAFEQ